METIGITGLSYGLGVRVGMKEWKRKWKLQGLQGLYGV